MDCEESFVLQRCTFAYIVPGMHTGHSGTIVLEVQGTEYYQFRRYNTFVTV